MRYYQIISGFGVPLSNEEREIFEKIQKDGKVYEADLEEHMQYVAETMHSKNFIKRGGTAGKYYYHMDCLETLWRI